MFLQFAILTFSAESLPLVQNWNCLEKGFNVVVPYVFGCVIIDCNQTDFRCFVPFTVSFKEGTVIAKEHWYLFNFRVTKAGIPHWSLYENAECSDTFDTPLLVRQYDVDLGFDLTVKATLTVNST